MSRTDFEPYDIRTITLFEIDADASLLREILDEKDNNKAALLFDVYKELLLGGVFWKEKEAGLSKMHHLVNWQKEYAYRKKEILDICTEFDAILMDNKSHAGEA